MPATSHKQKVQLRQLNEDFIKHCNEESVFNLHDKTEYFIHIRNSKQAWNHDLDLKKVHRVIKFNENLGQNHILIWIL